MHRMIHSLHLFPLYTDTVWFNKCTSVKGKILLAPPLWSSNTKTEKNTRTVNVLSIQELLYQLLFFQLDCCFPYSFECVLSEMESGALLLSLNYKKKTKSNKFFHFHCLESFRYLFSFGSTAWRTSGCTLRWRQARCWTTPVMSPHSPLTSRWLWRELDPQRSQLTWTSSENTTSSTTRTSFTLQPHTPSHSMNQQHLFTSVVLLVHKSGCHKDKQHHLVDAGVLRDDLSGRPVWWAVLNWFLMWTPRLKESSWKRRYRKCPEWTDRRWFKCERKVNCYLILRKAKTNVTWFIVYIWRVGPFLYKWKPVTFTPFTQITEQEPVLWLLCRSQGSAPSCGGWLGPACSVMKAHLHHKASRPSRAHWTPLWCWTSLGWRPLVTTGLFVVDLRCLHISSIQQMFLLAAA